MVSKGVKSSMTNALGHSFPKDEKLGQGKSKQVDKFFLSSMRVHWSRWLGHEDKLPI